MTHRIISTTDQSLADYNASIIQQSAEDIGVWIEVWNHDLQDCHEFRIHEEEMTYWADYYDENKKS
jgi:hypothetical protein